MFIILKDHTYMTSTRMGVNLEICHILWIDLFFIGNTFVDATPVQVQHTWRNWVYPSSFLAFILKKMHISLLLLNLKWSFLTSSHELQAQAVLFRSECVIRNWCKKEVIYIYLAYLTLFIAKYIGIKAFQAEINRCKSFGWTAWWARAW